MNPAGPREAVAPRDLAVVAGQLGRTPRDLTGIAARCPFGHPAVIETAPVLADGSPNPTLLYLTCPSLVTAVSRVEAAGGVRRFKAVCRADEPLTGLLREVTSLYRERRVALAGGWEGPPPGPRLEAGIGGPEGPEAAACLHAYAAALLAVTSGWLRSERTSADEAREVWARFLPPAAGAWCSDARCARWSGPRIAVIDVGTISVRLLVADAGALRPQTVVRRAEVTRLGEGLRPGGSLGMDAKTRTARAVERYAAEARALGAGTVLLAATSAARDAGDGEEFVAHLGREHALEAAVLSGAVEAELAFAGASLDVQGDPVVLDIGGGSTELMHRGTDGVVRAVSLDLGASRATERWIRSDPPTAREVDDIYQEAQEAFLEVQPVFGHVPARRQLVGVAGTVTTLACLDAGLNAYDPDRLHLRTMPEDRVKELVGRLGALTVAERAALPCMQPGRAAVIVGGAVILLAAMDTLGYPVLTVSERDLLDGLALRGTLPVC